MLIETEHDYRAAMERLAALGEGAGDGPGRQEYLDITAAMLAYETRNHPALEAPTIQDGERELRVKKAIVRCEDDYERAMERVRELALAVPGSPQEAELVGLEEAIEKWAARHEDDE